MRSLFVLAALGGAAAFAPAPRFAARGAALNAKKPKKGNKFKAAKQPKTQEKKKAQEERFDAVTRQCWRRARIDAPAPRGARGGVGAASARRRHRGVDAASTPRPRHVDAATVAQ